MSTETSDTPPIVEPTLEHAPPVPVEEKKVPRPYRIPSRWLVLIVTIPLLVGGGHFGCQKMDEKEGRAQFVVPKSGKNVVFGAMLGLRDKEGKMLEAGRGQGAASTSVTLWVCNLDGWLIDLAEGNEALMKEAGFTPVQWRSYHSNSRMKSSETSFQTDEDRKRFTECREWLSKQTGVVLPAELAGVDFTGRLFAPRVPASLKEEPRFPLSNGEAAQLKKWQDALLKMAVEQEKLLKDYKDAQGRPYTREIWSAFVQDIGKTWKQKMEKENQQFSNWLERCRQKLRLVIAGQVFENVRADVQGRAVVPRADLQRLFGPDANPDDDTVQLLFFRQVTPAKEELEVFRGLVSTYGVICTAPVTVALPLGAGHTLDAAPQMRSLVNDGGPTLELPLRPLLLRSLAWGLSAGVLGLILIVGGTSGTLREVVPQGHPLIKTWEQSQWSVSRVTFALWLAVCTACFVYLWAMRMDVSVLSGSAPLLLGIHGSTLLAASFVKASRELQDLTPTRGLLMDLLTEGREAEISRLQMVVWNGVLAVVFVWQTFDRWEMPQFDANLMTLLGISSTAYVGYKWSAQNKSAQPTT